MKKLFFSLVATMLAAVLLPTIGNAQVINGDLNHSGKLEVSDVTRLINNYLMGTSETLSGVLAPFGADNSCIVGKWYKSPNEAITFNTDGTTDYAMGYTYDYLPQGYILFNNTNGTLVHLERVIKATADSLTLLSIGSVTPVCYTVKQPIKITLSQASLELKPDEYVRLTATVEPSGAGTVTWSSSDESVATVVGGFVTAIADGTAVITASIGGASATCMITVFSKTYNNGHEYVDLGLSVKWATMNIGANSPEDYGGYFSWGETTTKSDYSWSTYKYCNGSEDTMTKYCTDSSYGMVDNKTMLEISDDAAHAKWGSTWRMPTYNELDELRTECTWIWTTQNGIDGYKVVGLNGNSIFLPLAGNLLNMSTNSNAGRSGSYWSRSLDTSASCAAFVLTFGKYGKGIFFISHIRCVGESVRAVCP